MDNVTVVKRAMCRWLTSALPQILVDDLPETKELTSVLVLLLSRSIWTRPLIDKFPWKEELPRSRVLKTGSFTRTSRVSKASNPSKRRARTHLLEGTLQTQWVVFIRAVWYTGWLNARVTSSTDALGRVGRGRPALASPKLCFLLSKRWTTFKLFNNDNRSLFFILNSSLSIRTGTPGNYWTHLADLACISRHIDLLRLPRSLRNWNLPIGNFQGTATT